MRCGAHGELVDELVGEPGPASTFPPCQFGPNKAEATTQLKSREFRQEDSPLEHSGLNLNLSLCL